MIHASTRVKFVFAMTMILLVVTGVASLLLVASSALAATENCQTTVVHDDFYTSSATIESFNTTGDAESVKYNTRAVVEESDAFYRVRAENPNGYCVTMRVKVSSAIMPSSELGTVSAVDGNAEAGWHDAHDFNRGESYTLVEFTAPANSTVTFAPSKPTVVLIDWRSRPKDQANNAFDRVREYNPLGGDVVNKRQYEFTANASDYATVPLRNPETGDRIQEWNAVYRTSPTDTWVPVQQNSNEPVFYRPMEDEDKIQFVFNERNARVKFTANPTHADNLEWSFRSWKKGFDESFDFDFLTITPSTRWVAWI